MSQPIFFTRKVNRKKEFRLKTYIQKNGSKFAVEKVADNKTSRAHLMAMLQTYNELTKNKALLKKANVVKPKKIDQETISFEFVDGETLERSIFNSIVDAKPEKAIKDFLRIFELIETVRSSTNKTIDSDSYSKVFGALEYSKSKSLLYPGIVDLNLDNIIIDDKNHLHLFDYEWSFKFGVPEEYIKTRVLWFFFHRHKQAMKFASRKVDMVIINGFLVLPEVIYTEFKQYFTDTDKFINTELAFQKYVSGNNDKTLLRVLGKAKGVKNFKQDLLGIEQLISDNENKTKTIATLESRVKDLKKSLNAINSSKAYRMSSSFGKIKSIIKK